MVTGQVRDFDSNSEDAMWPKAAQQVLGGSAYYPILQRFVRLTLPLSGRPRVSGTRSELVEACPLKGLVRRCRISTGTVCGRMLIQQRSSQLSFTSQTGYCFLPPSEGRAFWTIDSISASRLVCS
jgi:hypothetical protein